MAVKRPIVLTTGAQYEELQPGDTLSTGAMTSAFASGSGPTLSGTEAAVGSVTINVPTTTSKVLILARVNLLKDTGTTIRTATVRVRRGTTNSDPQVGRDSSLRSQGVASSDFGPGVVLAQDTPGVAGNVTYTVRALASASCTTPHYEIEAVLLEGATGPEGPTGPVSSVGFSASGPSGAFVVGGSPVTSAGTLQFELQAWPLGHVLVGANTGGDEPVQLRLLHVSDVINAQATIQDSGWQFGGAGAFLQNDWVDFNPATFPVAQYRKVGELVELRGVIKDGKITDGTLILTLPAGYRPSGRLIIPAPPAVRIDILPNGEVLIYGSPGNAYQILTAQFLVS